MPIGPCGLTCEVCGFYVRGRCEGCAPGDQCTEEKLAQLHCPTLMCASAHHVAYCSRDCSEYPCHLFELLAPCSACFNFQPGFQSSLNLSRHIVDGSRSMVRIFCLGRFRVIRPDGEIKPEEWGKGKGASHRVKMLLAYLAHCKGSCGASKDKLTNLLWPDAQNGAQLDSRFYATLFFLRRALEPTLKPRQASQLVRYEDGRCTLDRAQCWIDVDAVESYHLQAEHWERVNEHEKALVCWRMAAALYHGDYLADLSFSWLDRGEDDWYQWRREHLKEIYLTAVLQLAREAQAHCEYEKALDLAQHILQRDSMHEEAHQMMIRIQTHLGQQEIAARQGEWYRRERAKFGGHDPALETPLLL